MKKRSQLGIIAGILLISLMSFVSAGKWNIQDTLNTWADFGVFSYVLPFLLVFAVIFAILQKTNILGDNKGVIIIISLAIGLLSLVGGAVPRFFEGIFPYTAMAISILVVAVILIGLFFGEENAGMKNTVMWTLFGIGVIAFIIVAYSSLSEYNLATSNFWQNYGPAIATLLILAGIITLIAIMSNKASRTPTAH
jgi:hypothetical protein